MQVSTIVVAALTASRIGQLFTLSAVVLDPSLQDKGYAAALQRASAKHCPDSKPKELKTWANYVTAARACCIKCSDKFPSEPTPEYLTTWLSDQLKAGGYITAIEDVQNWAQGRPSIKARAATKKAEAVKVPVTPAVVLPVADPVPTATVAASTELVTTPTSGFPVGPVLGPITAPVVTPLPAPTVYLATFDGKVLELDASITADDIKALIEALQDELVSLTVAA